MQQTVFILSPLPDAQQTILQILQSDPKLKLHLFDSAPDAIHQGRELGCKIAILDCEFGSNTLQELARSLRSIVPEIYLLIIPPEAQKEQSYFPVLGFLPDGYVWRPFNPEELVEQINELLKEGSDDENLHGQFPLEPLFDVPPPEPAQEILLSHQAGNPTTSSAEVASRAENKPENKQTFTQEHQIKEAEVTKVLPRLLEITEAEFVLLIRKQKSWVLAETLSKKAVEEIREQALSVFPNGSAGNAIFFIHLQSNETDYQTFLSYLEHETLLVLAFHAQFPLRKIRLLTTQQILSIFGTTSFPPVSAGHIQKFTFVLVPQLARSCLTGTISAKLSERIREISAVNHWTVEHLSIRPDHVMWTGTIPEQDSAEKILTVVRQQTSEWIKNEFPTVLTPGTKGDFWASEHLLIGPNQPLPPGMIQELISRIRNQT